MFAVIIFCVIAANAAPYNGMYPDYTGIDAMYPDYYQPFPGHGVMYEGVDGKEYKLILSLPGFEERDIAVNVNNGVLTVHAAHKVNGVVLNNYLDQGVLPDYVSDKSSWTYTKGVLTVVIPLKSGDGLEKGDAAVDKVPEMNDKNETVLIS